MHIYSDDSINMEHQLFNNNVHFSILQELKN